MFSDFFQLLLTKHLFKKSGTRTNTDTNLKEVNMFISGKGNDWVNDALTAGHLNDHKLPGY